MNTYLPKPLAIYPDMLPAIIEEKVADSERHTVYWYYAMVTLVGQGGREGGRGIEVFPFPKLTKKDVLYGLTPLFHFLSINP